MHVLINFLAKIGWGYVIVMFMSEEKSEPNDHAKNSFKRAKHQFRMRNDWDNLIEDMIQDGQEQGMFDDLPGKGKPLNLNKRVFGAELDLAHSLMKDNDLAPAWILNRNQIVEKIGALRADIQRKWTRHEREFRVIQDVVHRDGLTLSWDDACQKWLDDIEKLNKQISDFNLKRPLDNMEIFKLDLESELKQVGAPRWLR